MTLWALVEGYHKLGKRILKEYDNFERKERYGKKITSHVSQSLNKSIRTIERAIQFAKKYSDLNRLPEGKAITWHKITKNLLKTH